MAEQTISWIWWNSMSGSTSSPTGWPAKSTAAIGRPVARDFLDPQNWITRSSAREKCRSVAVLPVSHRTTASSPAHTPISTTTCHGATECQMPSAMPSENAE